MLSLRARLLSKRNQPSAINNTRNRKSKNTYKLVLASRSTVQVNELPCWVGKVLI